MMYKYLWGAIISTVTLAPQFGIGLAIQSISHQEMLQAKLIALTTASGYVFAVILRAINSINISTEFCSRTIDLKSRLISSFRLKGNGKLGTYDAVDKIETDVEQTQYWQIKYPVDISFNLTIIILSLLLVSYFNVLFVIPLLLSAVFSIAISMLLKKIYSNDFSPYIDQNTKIMSIVLDNNYDRLISKEERKSLMSTVYKIKIPNVFLSNIGGLSFMVGLIILYSISLILSSAINELPGYVVTFMVLDRFNSSTAILLNFHYSSFEAKERIVRIQKNLQKPELNNG